MKTKTNPIPSSKASIVELTPNRPGAETIATATAQSPARVNRVRRRSFMRTLAFGGASVLPLGATFDSRANQPQNRGHGPPDRSLITEGDADILRFLAA